MARSFFSSFLNRRARHDYHCTYISLLEEDEKIEMDDGHEDVETSLNQEDNSRVSVHGLSRSLLHLTVLEFEDDNKLSTFQIEAGDRTG